MYTAPVNTAYSSLFRWSQTPQQVQMKPIQQCTICDNPIMINESIT